VDIRKRFVILTAVAALSGGGLIASSTSASAADTSCFNRPRNYEKPAGQVSTNGFYVTRSTCDDILIKSNTDREVKVCFYKSNGDRNYCQDSWKWAYSREWKTIATDVNDGGKFKYHFRSSSKAAGQATY
jgi:hypothetical protein